MRGLRGMLFGLLVSVGAVTGAAAQTVEIEYWQYVFDARIKAMTELIKRFEAANPTIKVKQGVAITVFVARDLDFTAVGPAR